MQTDLCEYCGNKPKYVDGTTTLDYCGKACAEKAKQEKLAAANAGKPAMTRTIPSNFCVICGQRPKYDDGVKLHDYCGKACAAKVQSTSAPPPLTKAPIPVGPTPATRIRDLCIVCGKNPKFKDGTKTHDYCGKACAAKANSANVQSAPAPISKPVGTKPPPVAKPAAPPAAPASGMCTVCGQRPRFDDGNMIHDYCGKACAAKAQGSGGAAPPSKPALCTVCGQRPKFNDGTKTYDYCGKACATKAQGAVPANAPVQPTPAPVVPASVASMKPSPVGS